MNTITLSPKGTKRRTVDIDSIVVPDIRPLASSHPDGGWGRTMSRYYGDLCRLLFTTRLGSDYPTSFLMPDLWHSQWPFDEANRAKILEAWHLGHDLLSHLEYAPSHPSRASEINNTAGVHCTVFFRKDL